MLFSDLSLSAESLAGLKKNNFVQPTEVQEATLNHSLEGNDCLVTAPTGSGKTLCFVITILEKLKKQSWTQLDGLGALVVCPTRELALQIFQVFASIGHHSFSCGLLIGGKDYSEESKRITRLNIIICTPGRLLHHLDQTPTFTLDNLQIVVLDEADRILDLGFKKTMDNIIQNLPKTRQTLLFSATLSSAVNDLARLSLSNPQTVNLDSQINLVQKYSIVELHDKLNVLWSFLKTHLKSKIIIFVTSINQVKYLIQTFSTLAPGIPLLSLHGKQSQAKRMAVYQAFGRKKFAALFCTDVAARGLDFAGVDWVVQLDCPEDADTYLHRVGRYVVL
jgi:ATP-dependent RNA helicase DDX10/DBP4